LFLEAIAGAIGAKLIGELLVYDLPGLVLHSRKTGIQSFVLDNAHILAA